MKFERIDIGAYEYQKFISPRGIEISNDTIPENIEENIFVGVLSTIHPYPTNTYMYKFNSDSLNNDTINFIISNDSVYTASINFNFENKNRYDLYIKTIDENKQEFTELISVNLKDKNDAPTGILLSNDSINEGINIGSIIGSFSTNDEDAVDSFTYSISTGEDLNNRDRSYFSINNNKLIVQKELNYEERKHLNVVVSSSDKEGMSVDQEFTIYVVDVIEHGINLFQSVKRTGAVSFVIDSCIYVGLGNNADSVMCNFWKYDLATDLWSEIAAFPGIPRAEGVSFVIGNKAYVGLGRSNYPYTYYKDFYEYNPQTNQWTRIADFGGSLRYNSVAFAIGSEAFVGTGTDESGELNDFWKYGPLSNTWTQIANITGDKRTGAVAFVINNKGYVSGGQYFDGYSVQLSDVQEYNPATNTWQEKIYADGINLSFADAASFVMGDKGYICYGNKQTVVSYNPITNEVVNYGDILNLTDKRFDPIAFMLDSTVYFGLGYYGVFTPVYQNDILVLNHLPTNIILSQNEVNENISHGALIGLLSTRDADILDSFTYSIVPGNGSNDADNGSFTINGNELLANTSFNFESQNQYSVYIQTIDAIGATFKREFKIIVHDINEIPTNISLSSNSINENTATATVVGEFITTDEDNGNTHTYTLFAGDGSNDADNSRFTISGKELRSNQPFNYENRNQYYVNIKTQDQNGEFFIKSFVIYINDVNDNPTDINLSNNRLDENALTGTLVGTFSSVDEDGSDNHSYSLVFGDGVNDADNSHFYISGSELRNNTVFDYETLNSYSILVETNDGQGGTYKKTFVIYINDITETFIHELNPGLVKIYPNPTSGLVNFEIDESISGIVNVKIINSVGQIISNQLLSPDSRTKRINLDENGRGIYYIIISGSTIRTTQKVILE